MTDENIILADIIKDGDKIVEQLTLITIIADKYNINPVELATIMLHAMALQIKSLLVGMAEAAQVAKVPKHLKDNVHLIAETAKKNKELGDVLANYCYEIKKYKEEPEVIK